MFCLNAQNLIIIFNNIKTYSNYRPKYGYSQDIKNYTPKYGYSQDIIKYAHFHTTFPKTVCKNE
jgi:hypothetical protein